MNLSLSTTETLFISLVESPQSRAIPDVTEWSIQRKGEWIYEETSLSR